MMARAKDATEATTVTANPKTARRLPRQPGTVDDRNKRPANADRLFQHAAEIMATQPVPPELDRDPNLPTWLESDLRWCCGAHGETDALADRDHVINAPRAEDGDGGETLSLYDRSRDEFHLPARVQTEMRQGVYDVEPRIEVSLMGARTVMSWLTLRLAEAEQVAEYLIQLAEWGRQALPTDLPHPRSRPPFWLLTDCPSWCSTEHSHSDDYGNRNHMLDESFDVPLFLVRSPSREPEFVALGLHQHYRSTQAVIEVTGPAVSGNARLTTWEAEALAANLTDLVEMAKNEAGA